MSTVAHPSRLPLFRSDVIYYLLGMAALGFTIDGGIYTVLFNLYILRLGYGPEFVGILTFAGMFVFALLSIPIGSIRYWSSHRLILVGLGVASAGMFTLPLAQFFSPTWQPAYLIVTRIFTLVGLAMFFVHSAPFVLQITQGDEQNKILAWQSAAMAVAGFGGGIIAGYMPAFISHQLNLPLTHPTPYQYPLMFAGIILLFGVFIVWRIPDPNHSPAITESTNQPPNSIKTYPFLRWGIWPFVILIVTIRFLQAAVPGILNTFANVYFDDGLQMPTNRIGLISAASRILTIPVAIFTPWVVAKWGNYKVLIAGLLITVAIMIPMALTPNWTIAGISFIIASSLLAVRYVTFLVFSLSLVPAKHHALISGAGEMAIGLGFALTSLAGGYIITGSGYSTLFAASIGLTLLGTVLFWFIFRKQQ